MSGLACIGLDIFQHDHYAGLRGRESCVVRENCNLFERGLNAGIFDVQGREMCRFRPSPPTRNALFFNELQKPEETSASENTTGQKSMIHWVNTGQKRLGGMMNG